jgi:hypothetical protein
MAILVLLLLAFPAHQSHGDGTPQGGQIRCEFRVFDGESEVTAETRIRVFPRGVREGGTLVEGRTAVVHLEPGIYDVQAVRHDEGRVLNISWAEHLLVMSYPDEDGHHLQVINFASEYGALQLRTVPPHVAAGAEAVAFPAGDRKKRSGSQVAGEDYVLLILPAGSYDVRLTHRSYSPDQPAGAAPIPLWLEDIEVPAGRTRLKTVPLG